MSDTARRPPKLATVILNHFGYANEAVAGDLREAYVAGKSAIWYWRQVLALVWHAFWRTLGASIWWSAAAVTTAVLVLDLPFLFHSSVPLDARRYALMALYLAPQAIVIAVPLGLAVGIVISAPSRVSPRILPVVLFSAVLLSAITFVFVGWVVPASNQAYRVAVAGPEVARGAAELTVLELHSLIGADRSSNSALTPISDEWDTAVNYYARFAIPCSAIAFAFFGTWVATLSRLSRRVVGVATFCVYLAYFLLVEPGRVSVFSPVLVAWFPTMSITAVAFLARWLSPERKLAPTD